MSDMKIVLMLNRLVSVIVATIMMAMLK